MEVYCRIGKVRAREVTLSLMIFDVNGSPGNEKSKLAEWLVPGYGKGVQEGKIPQLAGDWFLVVEKDSRKEKSPSWRSDCMVPGCGMRFQEGKCGGSGFI
jgi:hypothetical protein